MATEIKLRRGTTAQHTTNKGDGSPFTGAEGEVTYDQELKTLRVHDNSTPGGIVLAKKSDVEAEDTLAEMNDVNLTSLVEGSIIAYDQATSAWENPSNILATRLGLMLEGTDQKSQIEISTIVVGNPTTINTESAHGYVTGERAKIRNTNIALLDGSSNQGILHVITKTSNTQFTVAVNTTGQSHTTGDGILEREATGLVINDTNGYGKVEIGGSSGAYIDIKSPNSDDYDYRVITGGSFVDTALREPMQFKNEVANDFVRTSHIHSDSNYYTSAIFQYDATRSAMFYHGTQTGSTTDSNYKLAVTSTGIDVKGTVTADGLLLGDGEFSLLNGNLKIQSISNNSFIDHIDTNSSKLFIRAEGSTEIKSITSNKLQASFADSEVSLWYDNNKVLATENGGVNVTGTVTADGIKVGDNHNIILGDSNELVIKHHADGGSTITETGNGNLSLVGNAVTIKNVTGANEFQIVCDGTGATNKTKLYYGQPSDTSDFKLGTTTSGVQVKGTVTADGLNVDTSNSFATINVGTAYLDVISTDATSGLRLSNTNNSTAGQSDILFQRTANPVVNGTNTGIGQMLFEADNSGGSPFLFADITAYANQFTAGSEEAFVDFSVEDGSGSRNRKLRVNKDGIAVTGSVTADALTMGNNEKITLGAGGDLEIYSDGSDGIIKQPSGAGNNLIIQGQAIHIKDDDGNLVAASGGANWLMYHENVTKAQSVSSGLTVFNSTSVAGALNFREGTADQAHSVTLKPASNSYGNSTISLPVDTDGTMVVADSSGNVSISGTTTSDRFTGSQTHNIQSGNETMSGHVGEKTICVGATGTVTYTFPDVADGDKGDTWTVVNASNQSITCAKTGDTQFSKLVAGSNPASVSTVTVAKGGVAEFVVTEEDVITVFGSGIS